ncbi:MAG: hypothetical protein Q8P86_04010 [bacterium]|nr:hypothetical protein [bacterium]
MQIIKNKKVQLGFVIAALLFTVYFLFFRGGSDSPQLSPGTSFVTETVFNPVDIIVGRELLALLAEMKAIRIDKSIFDSPLFDGLNDLSVPIDPQPLGRNNPFAPFGSDVNATSTESATAGGLEI